MMNRCHHVFPHPLGKQRMHICRKSGLYPSPVRSYQGEIDEENLSPPYPDKQTAIAFCDLRCEKVIYTKKYKYQPSRTRQHTYVSASCRDKRVTEMRARPRQQDTQQVKGNTVSFAGQHLQKLAGFHATGWELTTSLHPECPVLSFSAGRNKEIPVQAWQQAPPKAWCLTQRVRNFSSK